MMDETRYYITTAIDYPNGRPHIGTAFEKIGADVQARFRRMEGLSVHFLMGNDENTIKVPIRARELGQEPKPYVDDMARQFREVWGALEISNDDFIQTSEPRHHAGCRTFIQAVHDAGDIEKRAYTGLYCDGCESFKTEKDLVDGHCPDHPKIPLRAIEEAVAGVPGLAVAGAALHGVGVPACVGTARAAAERLAKQLTPAAR